MQSCPSLCDYIRSLKIIHSPIQHGKTAKQSRLLQQKLVLDFYAFMSAISQLSRLQSLVLDYLDLFLPTEYDILDVREIQSHVEHFSFFAHDEGRAFALDDLFVFLTAFPAVRTLQFQYLEFFPGPETTIDFVPYYSNLEALKMRNNDKTGSMVRILERAASSNRLPVLKHIEVGWLCSDEQHSLRKLLLRLTRQLTHLTVQFKYLEADPDICECHCTMTFSLLT